MRGCEVQTSWSLLLWVQQGMEAESTDSVRAQFSNQTIPDLSNLGAPCILELCKGPFIRTWNRDGPREFLVSLEAEIRERL